ncbi:MAG: hypothetical protein H7145_14865 [Akkermansiaceae bacterium]|nr:hypothetical protein [Armatimonadota bacterium]
MRSVFIRALFCAPLIAGAFFVSLSPVWAQSLSSSISGYADTTASARADLDAPSSNTTALVSQFRNSSEGGASARTEGKAQSDYGSNKAFARANATGNSDSSFLADAEAIAISAWEDVFTINLAGMTGQAGTVEYTFDVDGSRVASGPPNFTNRQFLIRKDGSTVAQLSNAASDGSLSTGLLDIIYGTPFTLSATLRVQADAFSDEIEENAIADYFNTATLTSITHSGSDIGFESDAPYSGVAITGGVVVVPEAGTLVLLTFAATVGIFVRRRK